MSTFPIIGAATVQPQIPAVSPYQPNKPPIDPSVNWGQFAAAAATTVAFSVLGSYINGRLAMSMNADSVKAGIERSTSAVDRAARAAAAAETNKVLNTELRDKIVALQEDHGRRIIALEARQKATEDAVLFVINTVPGLREQYAAATATEAPQS